MKRIAFFLDGTWNRFDGERRTFVARLAECVSPKAADGVDQVVYYQAGVGTGRGSNRISRRVDRIMGGAFGAGLDQNIVDAYLFLAYNYRPGDEIFVFGFSRGAYTARSLIGLIRTAGIPARDQINRFGAALALYRKRADPADAPEGFEDVSVPDWPEYREFRLGFSPDVATSRRDVAWRVEDEDYPAHDPLSIAYLGVWDTVGTEGLPGVLGQLRGVVKSTYRFHDDQLSSMVRSARHAVAADEFRSLYKPTLWRNLERLNRGQDGADAPFHQLWFTGNHGTLGGSAGVPGLSAFPGEWIVEGARMAQSGPTQQGLEFDGPRLAAELGAGDLKADLPQGIRTAGVSNLFGRLLKPRRGLDSLANLHPSVRERMKAVPDYTPGCWPEGYPKDES